MRYWTLVILTTIVWATAAQAVVGRLWANPLELGWWLAAGLGLYGGSAIWEAYRATRALRLPVFITDPEVLRLPYEAVEFTTADGITLAGWYVAGQTDSAVILLHGLGENRLGGVPIARVLHAAGLGVLLFDLRAHGASGGRVSTWGWRETLDAQAALDYVCQRPEVQRVGLYGFSLGGQIALRTAAQDSRVAAVAADGAPPAVLGDHTYTTRIHRLRLWVWLGLVYGLQGLWTGTRPPAGILATIGQIGPRPLLLISTGQRHERNNHRAYFASASQPKELWEIPEARHGGGLDARREEYEAKIGRFFGEGLRG